MTDCRDCINYIDDGDDGLCHIYHYPNHGVSVCNDWEYNGDNE